MFFKAGKMPFSTDYMRKGPLDETVKDLWSSQRSWMRLIEKLNEAGP